MTTDRGPDLEGSMSGPRGAAGTRRIALAITVVLAVAVWAVSRSFVAAVIAAPVIGLVAAVVVVRLRSDG